MDTRSMLERLSLASLTDEACPTPEQLAAFILKSLDSAAFLTVAAHVRTCPLCQEDVQLVRPPEPNPRRIIARLLPSFTIGVRGNQTASLVRKYQAANLVVELTFAPPHGDHWRLTGQVLRSNRGVGNIPVVLRAGRRRPHQVVSDSDGFFTFEDLPSGTYTLSVDDGDAVVQIRGLRMSHDEQ